MTAGFELWGNTYPDRRVVAHAHDGTGLACARNAFGVVMVDGRGHSAAELGEWVVLAAGFDASRTWRTLPPNRPGAGVVVRCGNCWKSA